MAHNSLRPTLPSIHALFGLGDRDQLGTILDKPSKSPPPGEHRQASFPDRRTFFYARDEATVPIERSPHNNRDYHSNSPGSNGPRYTSGDLAYHESESLSIPSSRVIQPDSFITPQPPGSHGALRATPGPVEPSTYSKSRHFRSDHHINPTLEPSTSSTLSTRDTGRNRQHEVAPSRGRRRVAHVPPSSTDAPAMESTPQPPTSRSASSRSPVDKSDLGGRLVRSEEDPIASWKVKLYNGGPFESVVWSHVNQSGKRSGRNSQTANGSTAGATIGRYECNHCQKRFNRPSGLKIHLNTHTGDKPYLCPYPSCGRHFSVLSNMRRHSRSHVDSSQQEQPAVDQVLNDNDDHDDDDEDDGDDEEDREADQDEEDDPNTGLSWVTQRSTQASRAGGPIITSNSPSRSHVGSSSTGMIDFTSSSQPHQGLSGLPSSAISIPHLPNLPRGSGSPARYRKENGDAGNDIAMDIEPDVPSSSFRYPGRHPYSESNAFLVNPAADVSLSGTSPPPHGFVPTASIHERLPAVAEHRVPGGNPHISRHQAQSYRRSFDTSHSRESAPSASFAHNSTRRDLHGIRYGEHHE